MTADNFTEAARAEAERVHFPIPAHRTPSAVARASVAAFRDGASWARTYLAAQEPTDAEVEAAAEAICSGEGGCDPCFNWDDSVAGGCTYCTRHARAALSASRRNEKNR